jgi:hypothetical protein
MVGFGFGVLSIAWLVVDFLDSSVWNRRRNSGRRFEARLGIREVVVGVRGF